MVETRYGVISNIHSSPQLILPALDSLRSEGVRKVIFSGDIGESAHTIANILAFTCKNDLEVFAQPGGVETVKDFEGALQYVSNQFPGRITNLRENRKIEFSDHDLVSLPGAVLTRGSYFLTHDPQSPTGFYSNARGDAHFNNSADLGSLVTRPDRTIIISHNPPHFETDGAIDVAYFARGDQGILPASLVEAHIRKELGEVLPSMMAREAQKRGFELCREHKGDDTLSALYRDLGIGKVVACAFHETVGCAHDRAGVNIQEGIPSTELFWNPSYLDGGAIGILTVTDGRVAYQNSRLASSE